MKNIFRGAFTITLIAGIFSLLAGWGASENGVTERRAEGSVILFGSEAFSYLAPRIFLAVFVLGVVIAAIAALIDWLWP